ncbi:LOW QUALITY PROTEIN: epsin-1 [Clupea harengus]|uniref:LOW QUALITY PROTEIN: epsin-1 n=1 Tax=Clupea harengus TaxID=7950 RepID=A0A6P8GR16_CLUHA|nr:LOW QUALITY PROTEIN: epsin-1 [Clupea harengus]
MTHSMLRRTLKNLVQNFSEAEVKVREATSNDPWGPSSSQMSDISDLTYNVVACNEITGMLFKRLNDIQDWRHVHKSLMLLEYLLKTGADGVATAGQENVHVVKALTEFRFIDKDGKDQGATVREKAKLVLVLIEDPEKLKEEREMAMKHKDKLAKATTAAEEAVAEKAKPVVLPYTGLPSLDNIPSVAGLMAEMAAKKDEKRKLEEEKKLEERRAKGEGSEILWEQAATTAPPSGSDPWGATSGPPKDDAPAKIDPWGGASEPDAASNDPWGGGSDTSPPKEAPQTNDPWGGGSDGVEKESAPASNDPWGGLGDAPSKDASAPNDPWGGVSDIAPKDSPPPSNDPWGASGDAPSKDTPATNDPFSGGSDIALKDSPPASNDPWGASGEVPSTEAPAANDPWGGGSSDAPKDSGPATNYAFGGGSDIVPNNSAPGGGDLWGAPLDAPVESPPWETPAAKTSPDAVPANSDPWGAPTEASKPKPDPFDTPSESQEPKPDPWDAPSEARETKADPWDAPSDIPQAKADPWDAPSDIPQAKADPWDAPSDIPQAKADPWDAPSDIPQAKADPWGGGGDGASAASPSEPFGDGKADSDPWGAPATSPPPSGNDPWGAPPAALPSPGGDPFGGATDAWGTPTKSATNGDLTEGAKTKASTLSAPQGLSAWLDGLSLDLTMPSKGVNQTTPVAPSSFGFTPVTSSSFQSLSTAGLMGISSYTPLLPQGAPHHLTPIGGFPTSAPSWGAGMVAPLRQGAPYGRSPSSVAGTPMVTGMGMPFQLPRQPFGGGMGVAGANANNPFHH